MALTFFDYEIPVLKALLQMGGSAKTKDVYPVVEQIMLPQLKNHTEEYGHYKLQADIMRILFGRIKPNGHVNT